MKQGEKGIVLNVTKGQITHKTIVIGRLRGGGSDGAGGGGGGGGGGSGRRIALVVSNTG